MKYNAPKWLPSGHLQTIYPALYISKPKVDFRRERWDTPDGDFIDVDFVDGQAGQPFVVLFHGLEGSSDSHYARALMALVKERGWSGAVPHFRGCSGELNQAPRFYHSGDAQEIAWVIQRLQAAYSTQHPGGKFYAAGVSLGGNALLRWLGESPDQAAIVDAAVSISAPLDLAQGGASLSSGFNMLYTRMFLKTLKPKCLKKLDQFPGLFNRNALLAAKNLYEFDNVVTAPLHGYLDTDDYWNRASAKHVLPDIRVPTLVMNALNDPFLPGHHLPHKASSHVTLDYPKHGGHVGFAVGKPPGSLHWLPEKILHFFERGR
ncbi:putative alpha/beta-fold hydrolase [Undibacterium sp. GrIS 1.2]|uniref:YheT family hydrolase n=1 Tax=Undibacterium sp. GrIS 1.2 TaxID=3143933 RepID=UPI003396A2AB